MTALEQLNAALARLKEEGFKLDYPMDDETVQEALNRCSHGGKQPVLVEFDAIVVPP